ncbi:hypothetical protein JCM19037_3710 [Geomicrobium sp. JCM 19037]|uniref:methyl-accepting chemotaxis protein n=1 Tax=Geomicrobium sp. JCM 19037 TaxID=1460634 RepID=UPI00045F1E68|nr:HAMP domain-containing methyl-accepting chemotaxis protein [Geomicrobium sp. JCM 19037]GAK05229.1 hypothetical protein JCM19037_3710 [Geomicrobium sp. JCM 19037]
MDVKSRFSTIRSKMLLSLSFIIFCFLIGFVLIYFLLSHIQTQAEEMQHWNTYALKAQETSSTFQQKYIFVSDLRLQEEPDFSQYEQIDERMTSLLAELNTQISDEETTNALERFHFFNEMFDSRVGQYVSMEVVPGDQTLQGFEFINAELRELSAQLENYFLGHAESANENMEAAMGQAILLSIIIAIGASVIGSVLFILFSRRIQKQIQQISQTAKKVAAGQLHTEPLDVNGNDELSALSKEINTMTEQLRTIMTEMSNASQSIAASSEELVASSEEVNAGAEEVSGSVQEIADIQSTLNSSINQSNKTFQTMGSELDDVYAAVQDIVSQSEQSNTHAANGQKRLDQSLKGMQEIRTQNETTASTIHLLGEASKEIEHVITVIKDISGQTSLLALNANIEAARAGKAGKGFGVVADEVRKLAAESENAAASITETISNMTSSIQQSVEQSKESTQLISKGEHMLTEMMKTYQLILEAFRAVTEKSETIDQLVKRVTTNSNHIKDNLAAVQSTSTQATTNTASIAATVEEQVATMDSISDAAGELAEIANDLDQRMSRFKL